MTPLIETSLKGFQTALESTLGTDAISDNANVLEKYGQDDSFYAPQTPVLVVWPKTTADVQKIIRTAQQYSVSLVPVSSGPTSRRHGATIPKVPNSAIVDLKKR